MVYLRKRKKTSVDGISAQWLKSTCETLVKIKMFHRKVMHMLPKREGLKKIAPIHIHLEYLEFLVQWPLTCALNLSNKFLTSKTLTLLFSWKLWHQALLILCANCVDCPASYCQMKTVCPQDFAGGKIQNILTERKWLDCNYHRMLMRANSGYVTCNSLHST